MSGTYILIGCPDCRALFIVRPSFYSVDCPRCSKNVLLADRLPLATGDFGEVCDERGRLLAKRWHRASGEDAAWRELIADGPTAEQLDAWSGVQHPHAALVAHKMSNWRGIQLEEAEWWAHKAAHSPGVRYPHADLWWHKVTPDPGHFYRDGDGFLSPTYLEPGAMSRVAQSPRPLPNEEELLDELLRESAGPVPVLGLARAIFGPDTPSNGNDVKWTIARCKDHPLVEDVRHLQARPDSRADEGQERESQFLYALVTDEFHEIDHALDQQVRTEPYPTDSGGTDAQVNARISLSSRRMVCTAEQWGDLVGALCGYLKYRYEIEEPDRRPTRFTHPNRALSSIDRIESGFEDALDKGHRTGVVFSLTTDPNRYDSVWDAKGGLYSDVEAIRDRIGGLLGVRSPDFVTAVGPKKKGIPHAHMAIFHPNAADLARQEGPARRIAEYWNDKRAKELSIDPIVVEDDAWLWETETTPADVDGRCPVTYLSADPQAIASVTDMSWQEVRDVAEAHRDLGDMPIGSVEVDVPVKGVTARALRVAAWYWATELQASSRSRSVVGPDKSPAITATG